MALTHDAGAGNTSQDYRIAYRRLLMPSITAESNAWPSLDAGKDDGRRAARGGIIAWCRLAITTPIVGFWARQEIAPE
jgi:hypothetical protein